MIYKFIYYRLYKLALKSEKQWGVNNRMPHLVAFFSFVILQLVNLFTAVFILSKGFGLFSLPSPLEPIHGILICCSLYLINYFLILSKKKYFKIEKEFDKSLKDRKKELINLLFWTYLIGTIPLFFIVVKFFS